MNNFPKGKVIRGRQLTELATAINDGAHINGPRDVAPDFVSKQTQPLRVVIVTVHEDTLFCQDPDVGQDAEELITYHVAKPYLLRGSLETHDGATFVFTTANTRVASLEIEGDDEETVSENQTITPQYIAGDELFIAAVGDSGIRDYPQAGDTVDWIDLNVDGRMWGVDAE